MLVSRCAWHSFFRGYPRPLRVVSWRGAGIEFTDTICRSCAERVRIEGLWGPSPPPPVWPGSAQTAALFVGLPLLMALVLMAAPLHDAPPPAHEPAAAAVPGSQRAEAPVGESAVAPGVRVPGRQAAASRPRRPEPVPAVIFEMRRSLPRYRDQEPQALRTSASLPPPAQRVRRAPTPDPLTLAAVVARGDVRGRAPSETQSP